MCIEQTAFAHGVIHLQPGHGDSEANKSASKYGRTEEVEESQESTFPLFPVFNDGLGNDGATAGAEWGCHGIRCIVVEEGPCRQSG